MIKRLCAFDMDGTLIDSPMPETGKRGWELVKKTNYKFLGWWGRPESLDLDVFDIKPFPSVLKQLEDEVSTPETFVIILTSRMEKLRPQVQAILDANCIQVDKLDMKRAEGDKGKKILRYVEQFPELEEINVFEDRSSDIQSYEAIRCQLPKGIVFNVYLAKCGTLVLLPATDKLVEIVREEIQEILKN